ncbi:unnamed protein product [Rotaria sordida]|uniref:G-protein coupled receptors family 1 profile domain-containing protein n=1 Tax=Rotaria sordida TaxID=392033 RepID=A0A814PF26_9BILA|nr:unnamed protein product [Rotaria sordida]
MASESATALYILSIGDRLYQTVAISIIIVSTIGNVCNCFVFLCIPPLNKHPNALFIIGSSVGSFFFINIGLSSAIIRVYSGTDPSHKWLFWCKLATWFTYSSGCFSFMCNCFAALGQFLLTLPRVRWHRLITHIRAQIMLFCTAIIWFFIFLPFPIFYIHVPLSNTTFVCTSSYPLMTRYGTYWIIIGYYFLPIILILILFCLTRYNLQQLLRRRRTLDAAVTRMMLIQMCILLISGIPAGLYLCYILATQYVAKTTLRFAYEYLILLVLKEELVLLSRPYGDDVAFVKSSNDHISYRISRNRHHGLDPYLFAHTLILSCLEQNERIQGSSSMHSLVHRALGCAKKVSVFHSFMLIRQNNLNICSHPQYHCDSSPFQLSSLSIRTI